MYCNRKCTKKEINFSIFSFNHKATSQGSATFSAEISNLAADFEMHFHGSRMIFFNGNAYIVFIEIHVLCDYINVQF